MSSASIRSYIDCDLSAQQPGFWFGAQKLKCEQMNRKGNGSTEGMWNQISLTLRFLLCAHWLTKNAAPDNLHYQSNLSLFSFSSHSHPLVFLSSSLFCFPPSVFTDGLFGRWKGRELCQLWVYTEAKGRNLLKQPWELDLFVGDKAETPHGGADTVQVVCVCRGVCVWGVRV